MSHIKYSHIHIHIQNRLSRRNEMFIKRMLLLYEINYWYVLTKVHINGVALTSARVIVSFELIAKWLDDKLSSYKAS